LRAWRLDVDGQRRRPEVDVDPETAPEADADVHEEGRE
jgi:hypothetical protein